MTNKLNWYWLITIAILVVISAIGGVVIWLRYDPGRPVEISSPPSPTIEGRISIDGAVTSPGIYPLTANDSIDSLLQAAGGATASANLSGLKLQVTRTGDAGPQKIDINRADAWLLEALPGIGATLAQRIVAYRNEHGPFRTTADLLKVSGFGDTVYQKIKYLITVGD